VVIGRAANLRIVHKIQGNITCTSEVPQPNQFGADVAPGIRTLPPTNHAILRESPPRPNSTHNTRSRDVRGSWLAEAASTWLSRPTSGPMCPPQHQVLLVVNGG